MVSLDNHLMWFNPMSRVLTQWNWTYEDFLSGRTLPFPKPGGDGGGCKGFHRIYLGVGLDVKNRERLDAARQVYVL